MNIEIRKAGDMLEVHFPFHPTAKDQIKAAGGRWNPTGKFWIIKPEFETRAREILRAAFGTDGSEPAETVELRVTALRDLSEYEGPVTCCGKVLARAWGRDSGAKVGDDVALISGRIASGGSRKNWKSTVEAGSTFQLVNVPATMATDYDPDHYRVEPWDGGELENPLAGFTDNQIRAEAERRGLI